MRWHNAKCAEWAESGSAQIQTMMSAGTGAIIGKYGDGQGFLTPFMSVSPTQSLSRLTWVLHCLKIIQQLPNRQAFRFC